MGIEKEFLPVKLFCGFIYRNEGGFPAAKKKLEELFSPADLVSEALPFDFTTYYHKEMGAPLFRRFVSFERLIPPDRLPDIKLSSNRLEIDTTHEGCRTFNLDPGYLSDANVIIATTKNYYHRVPLQKGIYAHIEYVIKGKKFCPLEWTYPDFKSPGYLDFFGRLLQLYKTNLKALR